MKTDIEPELIAAIQTKVEAVGIHNVQVCF